MLLGEVIWVEQKPLSDFKGEKHPVTTSWHEAALYCNHLSQKMNLRMCYSCKETYGIFSCITEKQYKNAGIYSCPGFRLPTEAEWEYAYRAGTDGPLYAGSITGSDCINCKPIGALDSIAWHCGNTKDRKKRPVALKIANRWGLYDMAGNVEEWCHDGENFIVDTSPVTNPCGDEESRYRMIRNGGASDYPKMMRASATRKHIFGSGYGGFRCVRTLK